MTTPTDLEILGFIYDHYYQEFSSFDVKKPCRLTKNFVAIDVNFIGRQLGIDGDIVFGRLHYHLNNKYTFKNSTGDTVSFFANSLGTGDKKEVHLIHFPYMASVLAELRTDKNRYLWSTWLAVASLTVSSVALLISLMG